MNLETLAPSHCNVQKKKLLRNINWKYNEIEYETILKCKM